MFLRSKTCPWQLQNLHEVLQKKKKDQNKIITFLISPPSTVFDRLAAGLVLAFPSIPFTQST